MLIVADTGVLQVLEEVLGAALLSSTIEMDQQALGGKVQQVAEVIAHHSAAEVGYRPDRISSGAQQRSLEDADSFEILV